MKKNLKKEMKDELCKNHKMQDVDNSNLFVCLFESDLKLNPLQYSCKPLYH